MDEIARLTPTFTGVSYDKLNKLGTPLGPMRELSYYRAFTFRDPEGLLLEINSEGPGFALDEAPGKLGQRFTLPIWEMFRKKDILDHLPPFSPDTHSSPTG